MPTDAPAATTRESLEARLAALSPEERERLELAVIGGYIAALREWRDEIQAGQGRASVITEEAAA